MMTLGIVSLKGGAGKTQAAVHLAHAAARIRRVAVLDLDPTHQAVNWIQAAGMGIDAVALDLGQVDLERYLESVRAAGEHDLVIIDTPANDLNAALETLMVSDVVVVPVGVGTSDIGMLATTERQIRRAQQVRAADGRAPIVVRVLINRSGFAPTRALRTTQAVETFGMAVFEQQIPLRAAYQEATGNPITGEQHHYAGVLREVLRGTA